jgi:RNA polymerase sigma-70 factor (ECF subfamily)
MSGRRCAAIGGGGRALDWMDGGMTGRHGPSQSDAAAGVPVESMLRQAAGGDAEAWRRLVEAYHRRVYGLIVRQCGDRDLADEITQVTFVKLVEKLRTDADETHGGVYEERGRFEPWLFRVAMNGLRDEMRRRRRQATGTGWDGGEPDQPDVAEDPAQRTGPDRAAGGDPLDAVSRAEQLTLVEAAMADLGDADREVLHLRHTAGLSFPEIAQTLGQPLGTVLARAHRALGKLRKRLEQQLGADQADSTRGEAAGPQRRAGKTGRRP